MDVLFCCYSFYSGLTESISKITVTTDRIDIKDHKIIETDYLYIYVYISIYMFRFIYTYAFPRNWGNPMKMPISPAAAWRCPVAPGGLGSGHC